ncbi:MAG: site-specific integrase [Paenibacillaceae bacterium]
MLYAEALVMEPAPSVQHLGRAGIKSWIWENKVVTDVALGIFHEYMKRSMSDDAHYFYRKYLAIVELQQIVANMFKLPHNRISNELLLSQSTLLYLDEHATISPVKCTIIRFLEDVATRLGYLETKLSTHRPSREKKAMHSRVLQYQQQLQSKGFTHEYIRHCVVNAQELFNWLCVNISDFSNTDPQKMNILKIKNVHLLSYRSYLLKKVKVGNSSPITISHKISAIRLFFFFLKERYGYDAPLQRFRAIKAPRYRSRDIPSDEQIEALFQVINVYSDNPTRDQIAYRLLLTLGLRLSEAAQVKWEDINLGTRTLVIHSKGGKSHILPLAGKLYEYIQKAWDHQAANGLLLGDTSVSISHSLYNNYKLYALIAGWTFPGGVHFFRHIFITRLTHKNILPQALKELTRVVNLDTVSLYIHISRQKHYMTEQINMLKYD